jgi:hypothetical protein
MQRTDAILTRAQIRRNNQQIERGLNSRYSEDRAQFARRSDFTPMPEQIERGLTDECAVIRAALEVIRMGD